MIPGMLTSDVILNQFVIHDIFWKNMY